MTPRVPLVCTPEDLYRAMADVAKVVNGPPIFGGPALIPESVLALFRPAEERKEAERNTGFDSRSGATLPSSSGAGMANPVAGGRAPGQDALSSAPAAPPPAEKPSDFTTFQASFDREWEVNVKLREEVAALRAENERYAAVMRLCADDVVTCYPTDDGTVKVAVNLNDYFVPASDGEEIEMADAPTLVALMDQGGWQAIYQWVADRRGVPNRHWRLKPPIDSSSVPSGENRSEG